MKQKLLKILYSFLAFCTRVYLKRNNIQVVAITGSVGKTSCRMVVAEVLEQIQILSPDSFESGLRIYTSPKNYNSELGLVFSVFQIEDYHPSITNLFKISGKIFIKALFLSKKYDILVAEYGIDAPGDMDHLLQVAIPDIVVLTKLDSVHSANFSHGIEEYWQEKWKLLLAAKKKVYLNLQDDFSRKNISFLTHYGEIFEELHFGSELQKDEKDIARWHFIYNNRHISLNLLGEENIVYTKLGLDIAQDFGINLSENKYDFDFELQAGRFTLFQKGGNIFIDSSYNAAPESMRQVLENTKLLQKKLFPLHKIIVVLGDMRELGKNSPSAHQKLATYLGGIQAGFFIGPQMYEHLIPQLQKSGIKYEIHASLSAREIGKKLKNYLKNNMQDKYLIVIKGSQNTIFTEEVLPFFLTPTEQKKLPRQSEAWKLKKEEFFKGV